MKLDYRRKS